MVRGYFCVYKPLRVCQYPRVLLSLLRLGLGYHQTEVYKESILSCRGGWRTEGWRHAPPEVIFMLPQSGAVEAPKDQVMIRVVPGFPGVHVTKETKVRLQYVVSPRPHIPPYPEHAPHPFVSVTGA